MKDESGHEVAHSVFGAAEIAFAGGTGKREEEDRDEELRRVGVGEMMEGYPPELVVPREMGRERDVEEGLIRSEGGDDGARGDGEDDALGHGRVDERHSRCAVRSPPRSAPYKGSRAALCILVLTTPRRIHFNPRCALHQSDRVHRQDRLQVEARRKMQSNPAARYNSDPHALLARPAAPPNPFAAPPNPFAPAGAASAAPIPNPFPPAASTSQIPARARPIKPAKRIDSAAPGFRPHDSPLPGFPQRGMGSNRFQQPPNGKIPLSSLGISVPPLSAITDPRYQAMYTTYPSRMRLGTSSLMQPNYLAVSTNAGDASAGTSAPRRPRHVVNYAEIEGLEDSEDETNDVEGVHTRKRPAPPGMVPKRNGGESETSKPQWGDGKSYLGVPAPEHLVLVQRATPTKHGNLSVRSAPFVWYMLTSAIARRMSWRFRRPRNRFSCRYISISTLIRSRSEIPSSGMLVVRFCTSSRLDYY